MFPKNIRMHFGTRIRVPTPERSFSYDEIKKAVDGVLAAVSLATCVGGMSVSAYTSKGSWSTQYVHGSPSSPATYTGSVSMYTYGGGYQTYCSSLTGANDRYVVVSANGMTSYNITSTGYSGRKCISTSASRVTMYFNAHSSVSATGKGTAGYY